MADDFVTPEMPKFKRITETKGYQPIPPIDKIADWVGEDLILTILTRKDGKDGPYYKLQCASVRTGELLTFFSSHTFLMPRWEAIEEDDLPFHIMFEKKGNAFDVK